VAVDDSPLTLRPSITCAAERRFVVRGDLDVSPALIDGAEELNSEFDIVGRWLTAVLHERVGRLAFGEGDLIGVREVEVVYAEDDRGEVVGWGGEGVGEGFDLLVLAQPVILEGSSTLLCFGGRSRCCCHDSSRDA